MRIEAVFHMRDTLRRWEWVDDDNDDDWNRSLNLVSIGVRRTKQLKLNWRQNVDGEKGIIVRIPCQTHQTLRLR